MASVRISKIEELAIGASLTAPLKMVSKDTKIMNAYFQPILDNNNAQIIIDLVDGVFSHHQIISIPGIFDSTFRQMSMKTESSVKMSSGLFTLRQFKLDPEWLNTVCEGPEEEDSKEEALSERWLGLYPMISDENAACPKGLTRYNITVFSVNPQEQKPRAFTVYKGRDICPANEADKTLNGLYEVVLSPAIIDYWGFENSSDEIVPAVLAFNLDVNDWEHVVEIIDADKEEGAPDYSGLAKIKYAPELDDYRLILDSKNHPRIQTLIIETSWYNAIRPKEVVIEDIERPKNVYKRQRKLYSRDEPEENKTKIVYVASPQEEYDLEKMVKGYLEFFKQTEKTPGEIYPRGFHPSLSFLASEKPLINQYYTTPDGATVAFYSDLANRDKKKINQMRRKDEWLDFDSVKLKNY
ncbi:MAG: hypothetical protein KAT91_00610 [Candidatus Aenigmarchaeota archaeon]|nr:hypothetical protein [Candidatus Aenigmarchaeota archaeon]